MDDFDCLEDFYGWVWLFTTHLWVGVTVYSILMSGCGWLGKMVKPVTNGSKSLMNLIHSYTVQITNILANCF